MTVHVSDYVLYLTNAARLALSQSTATLGRLVFAYDTNILWRDNGTGWDAVGTYNTGVVPAFATPALVLGTAAAAGAASTVIRSDATIAAFDATAPSTQAYGDSAATGSAVVAARRDHKHAMPAVASDVTLTTTDITTNDVSTSKHGFAPKAPNDSTKFLNGSGAYAVPPGTGVTTVTGTSPIASSGGTTPAISIAAATNTAVGALKDPVIAVMTADKTITNTTTETTMFGTIGRGTLTLPANLLVVGSVLRITLMGMIHTLGNTPKVRIRVKLGSTVILDTRDATLVKDWVTTTGSATPRTWALDVNLICRTTGSSGTVMGSGTFGNEVSDPDDVSTGNYSIIDMVGGSAATVNTTTTQVLDVMLTWGAAATDYVSVTKTGLVECL